MDELAKKRIIGAASEIAGGTTTFASYADKYYGASTHRFSIPLREVTAILRNEKIKDPFGRAAERMYMHKEESTMNALAVAIKKEFGEDFPKHLEESRDVLQRVSTVLRQTIGENCLAQAMYGDVYRDKKELIVVEGVRRLADITMLKSLPDFTFIYVDTEPEIRYERFLDRKQNPDEEGVSYEAFLEICNQESETQIRGLKKHADVVIENNGTLKELVEKMDSILK